jgi:hypothetical protein
MRLGDGRREGSATDLVYESGRDDEEDEAG